MAHVNSKRYLNLYCDVPACVNSSCEPENCSQCSGSFVGTGYVNQRDGHKYFYTSLYLTLSFAIRDAIIFYSVGRLDPLSKFVLTNIWFLPLEWEEGRHSHRAYRDRIA
jgi:hypothetical protein